MGFGIVQIFLVLIILGFAIYMGNKYLKIADPIKEVMLFLGILFLIVWLLNGFHIIHVNPFGWFSK